MKIQNLAKSQKLCAGILSGKQLRAKFRQLLRIHKILFAVNGQLG